MARQEATQGGCDAPHRPVLLKETVELLLPDDLRLSGGTFVDATLGLGGHSTAMLEAAPQARIIGIDRDTTALEYARKRLAPFGERVQIVHADYRELKRVLAELGIGSVAGVLADLGVSSLQFDSPERGFSFRYDAPLDMRMNTIGDDETAAELLARLPEAEIARIIYEYGEERASRRIARRIVERREAGAPVETTGELAELVRRAVGKSAGKERVHPATRTFQALRVAVNRELDDLDRFVEDAIDVLQPGGRFVCISFHSLEDRIIKRTLRRLSGICECDPRLPICECKSRRAVEILTKRPLMPGDSEVEVNPRARSAKLRACFRLKASTTE